MEANVLSGPDTIILPPGTYTLSIPPKGKKGAANGDLDIHDELVITGGGAGNTIIHGAGISRVFRVLSGATVEITGVNVRNGNPG